MPWWVKSKVARRREAAEQKGTAKMWKSVPGANQVMRAWSSGAAASEPAIAADDHFVRRDGRVLTAAERVAWSVHEVLQQRA